MQTMSVPAPAFVADDSALLSFRVQQIRTRDDFYAFCQDNPTHKFEREPDGRIIVRPNTGGKTGMRNSELNADVIIWNRQAKPGRVFDSSTAFDLPDGSTRSPDVAWISPERWDGLSEREQDRTDARKFPPLCPDFVIGLLSPAIHSMPPRLKWSISQANGCRLAWLIDPKSETTHIFHANGEIQIVQGFDKSLSGEDVLAGFALQL